VKKKWRKKGNGHQRVPDVLVYIFSFFLFI
jgi:hypothetical protein